MLGVSGRGSILTASPFSYSGKIGVPAVDHSGSSTNCCCIYTWYLTWYMVRVVSVSSEKYIMLVLPRTARKILHSYK